MNRAFDVIVVGGGHAGCEAALAAARTGARTVLVSIDKSSIGRLSCNPSVGGIGKSHITRELDALGGEQARNTDYTGVQFRMINTRKGPAVQAQRAQCDKLAYPARMQAVIENQPGLKLIEGMVAAIRTEHGQLRGVVLAGGEVLCGKTVVLTAGTFLRGRILIGRKIINAGRWGEAAADDLSVSLENLGFELERLKTGTPPRLHRESIDYSVMEIQPGDTPPPFFSSEVHRLSRMFHVEQSGLENEETGSHTAPAFPGVPRGTTLCPWTPGAEQMPCWLTHTTATTHQIISDNLKKSALYGGLIEGTGVRYCPSIEDKVVKFSSRSAHHVFIEPEGRGNIRIYPNGTSNSLPEEIQLQMIHSIPGLEKAAFIRPGYAIEYDFVQPTGLFHSLETRKVENLFFAGQINGTTGYEEAAGQGFIAGLNAARKVQGLDPVVLGRDEAYIGVLIDDLVIKGTDEPYRMFTSRAEHRLTLRQDNVRFRLRRRAGEIGIVSRDELNETDRLQGLIDQEIRRLRTTFSGGASLAQILCQPGQTYAGLPGADRTLPDEVSAQVETVIRYEGYIQREQKRIAESLTIERQRIPSDFDYDAISALRFESREKLKKIRPENLGQAARISGVNPADISILSVWLKSSRKSVG